MGLKNCEIHFNHPARVYYGGETVSGRVELSFDSAKKIRGIYILFKGEAHTKWMEHVNDHRPGNKQTRTVFYRGHEEYFTMRYYIVGGPNGHKVELPPGKHIYPFQYTLPIILPSSFEGEFGYVRYVVKVTLERPWKFNQTSKAAFTVNSTFDLNMIPFLKEPVTLTMEKNSFFQSYPIKAALTLPYSGFVPGQNIPCTIHISNWSDLHVEGVQIKLVKMVRYYSSMPSRHTKTCEVPTAKIHLNIPVAAKTENTLIENLTLPSLPPSTLNHCNVIDINYELKLKVVVSGFHRNSIGILPVTIGTIPLTNTVPTWTNNATNTNPNELPPPTYEESQFGTKSILDESDSGYTRFNQGCQHYAPMYPVYNFATVQPPSGGYNSSSNSSAYSPYNPNQNFNPSAPKS